MPRYLVNEKEARALQQIVDTHRIADNLRTDSRRPRQFTMPFRFKTLEAWSTTIANKARSAIYHFGDSTANIIDRDYVVDDSSSFVGESSGYKGVCFTTSAYFAVALGGSTGSTAGPSTAISYMGKATAAYASSDLTITVGTLEPMEGTGTTLTTLNAYNKFAWNILSSGECYIKWNQYSSRFDLIQTKCT